VADATRNASIRKDEGRRRQDSGAASFCSHAVGA